MHGLSVTLVRDSLANGLRQSRSNMDVDVVITTKTGGNDAPDTTDQRALKML